MAETTLRISQAAQLLGVHPNTVRTAIKSGELKATLRPGEWGRPQYAINPAVFKVWAHERFGREVDADQKPSEVGESERQLYERLVKQTEELARYRAIESVTGEWNDLHQEVDRLREENHELQLQLARRGIIRRLF